MNADRSAKAKQQGEGPKLWLALTIYVILYEALEYFHRHGWRWAEWATVGIFVLSIWVWNIVHKRRTKAAELAQTNARDTPTDLKAP